jgi:hypothetical protein
MPFSHEFNGIYEIMKGAARDSGTSVYRADDVKRAGPMIDQIKEHIEAASFIIADLTGQNANVFYETAIAHMVKTPHQVILISQDDPADIAADLRAKRYIPYSNTAQGGQKLREELCAYIKEAFSENSGAVSETIDRREKRTQRIVADCEALLEGSTEALTSFEIYSTGALSSLAISPKEKDFKDMDPSYSRSLQQERDRIIELIEKGATFRAILAPRLTGPDVLPDEVFFRYRYRFEHLIELLSDPSRILPIDRVEIALIEPFYVNNTLILGKSLLYEGIKTHIGGGFDLTIRLTDRAQIAARRKAFDDLFEDAKTYTRRIYGDGKRGCDLRRASIRGIKQLYEQYLQMVKKRRPPPTR